MGHAVIALSRLDESQHGGKAISTAPFTQTEAPPWHVRCCGWYQIRGSYRPLDVADARSAAPNHQLVSRSVSVRCTVARRQWPAFVEKLPFGFSVTLAVAVPRPSSGQQQQLIVSSGVHVRCTESLANAAATRRPQLLRSFLFGTGSWDATGCYLCYATYLTHTNHCQSQHITSHFTASANKKQWRRSRLCSRESSARSVAPECLPSA